MTASAPSSTARTDRLSGTTGLVAALVAASCCLLPIALIALGVVGAGFMMTMMRYEWITLPVGVLGLAGAYAAYFRTRRQCQTAGCRFASERLNRVLLMVATPIVIFALLLRFFPSWTAGLLSGL
jgi:mercuric ion transport protein